ncbi:MAG: spermidine synthase, partial [Thermomicrobiales bacterium]
KTYSQIPRVPRQVLIIGAGTGSDVAIALQRGAQHIDAVEIDPTLLRFGRQHNPNRAYSDPRVSAHVNDGRAFLQQSHRKYDLIIFALPDSLTLVSGASSLRLESYLFTEQAFSSARAHLAPGGAFSMYNFYREQWLVDRFGGMVTDVFGHPPCLYENARTSELAVLTAGLTPADQSCTRVWHRGANTPVAATDDRPFPYLEHWGIPSLYRTTLLLIVLGSVLAIGFVLAGNAITRRRDTSGRQRGHLREMWSYRDRFLLGAAFLLLETKAVTGFALLFGTTWLVNSLVFTGILIAVLAAVETARALPTPPIPVMYALLIAALALNWLVSSSWLLSLGFALRAVVAIVIAFLPVYTANIIFAKRFAETADAPIAFGTNLLGAILGGCLEYLSLQFGNRALLLIAGALYVLAYVITLRVRSPEPAEPESELAVTG